MVRKFVHFFSLGALIVALSIAAPTELRADASIRFVNLDRDRGLTGNSIYSIVQDRHGFMWFGAADGLNRFDGERVVTYRHESEDPGSLVHNFIRSLYEDRDGRLWVATLGGVDRYDAATDSFHHYGMSEESGSTSDSKICGFHEDDLGLWVGTQSGVDRYDRQRDRFEPLDLSSVLDDGHAPHTHSLLRDRRGDLFVGTIGQGLVRISAETGEMERFHHRPAVPGSLGFDEVWALEEDPDGTIWVGGHGGLDRYDPATETFSHFRHDPDDPTSLSSPYVETLLIDSRGDLWIGTDGGGANLFDRETGTFRHLRHVGDNPMSLADDVVRDIAEDHQGNLWFGTYNGGVSYQNRETRAIEWVSQGSTDRDLGHPAVLSFFEDRDGSLFVGTENGLDHFDAEGRALNRYRSDPARADSLRGRAVLSVLRDRQGSLWVGTYFGGLHRLDPRTGGFENFRPGDAPGSLINPHVWDILEDREGRLWVTTFGGIGRFSRETGTFSNYRPRAGQEGALQNSSVWQVYEDSAGRLWFPTHYGLSLYLPEVDGFRTYLHDPQDPTSIASNLVLFVTESADGGLWVATEGGGLALFDPDSETFRAFGPKQGLATDTVYCLAVEEEGVWASTSGGLSYFDGSEFTNFGLGEGLVAQPFTKLACLRGRDGRLYFGGTRGFNRFRSGEIGWNPEPQKTVLTDLRLFNRSVRKGPDSPLSAPIMDTRKLVLDHEQSMIGFEMRVFDYRNPARNRYRYRLDDFNDDWVEPGSDRIATYTNLDPGEYVLRVQGANSQGVWSEQETTLELRILPPYWETWWFRSGILSLILGAALGFHFFRLEVVRTHNQALEAEIEQRRQVEEERQKLLDHMEELIEDKVAQLRVLQGMLPICASCKRIRDDEGYWADLEIYIHEHSEATFSHGICPNCMDSYAPGLDQPEPAGEI